MPTNRNDLMHLTLACLVLFLAACTNGSALGNSGPAAPSALRASLEPCNVPGLEEPALCGVYEVWEDREKQAGRRIPLKIVVVPAQTSEPELEGFTFLHGGPGAPATDMTVNIVTGLPEIHATRDMVFVDQRGTGESNPLDCDLSGKGGILGFLGTPEAVAQCREELSARADLALYTTPIAMDDLDEVFEALGYPQVDLYGGSYGTRAALVYLRRHPGRVRSVVLRGIAPPSMHLPLSFARDTQRALDIVFDDCLEDADCSAAYADVRERFWKLVASLPEQDRPGGPPSRDDFLTTTRKLLYAMKTSRQIPWIVDHASRGNFEPYKETLRTAGGIFNVRLNVGMMLSVICAEDTPFYTEAEAEQAAEGTFMGASRTLNSLKACAAWERGEIPDGYHEPTRSDVPVLLISGYRDPVTPPVWGDGVARYLSNSRHVIVPSLGHSGANRCLGGILQSFVLDPDPARVDESCVADLEMPPFQVE